MNKLFKIIKTKEELMKIHNIQSDTNSLSNSELLRKTNDIGFLVVGETQLNKEVSYFNSHSSLETLLLYRNMIELLKKTSKKYGVTKLLSNINTIALFKSFTAGNSYNDLNIRVVAEWMNLYNLSSDDLKVAMSYPIVITSNTIEIDENKHKNTNIGSKHQFGNELKKLIANIETNPLECNLIDDHTKSEIRSVLSGKKYPHIELFTKLMRFCGLNPIDALKRYQYLAVIYNDITTNKECTLYSNLDKQQLDAFYTTSLSQKDTCNDKPHNKTINKEYLENIYIRDIENNSKNASVFAEYVLSMMNSNLDVDEIIRDILSSSTKDSNALMIVDFINEVASITLDDILKNHQTTKYCEFSSININPTIDLNNNEYCNEKSHDGNINPNNQILNIEISVKKKYYCKNDYWKNENPNKNEDGYYWDYVDKEIIQSIEKLIKSAPFEELSIKNVQSIVRDVIKEDTKGTIKAVKFGAEMSRSASS